MGLIFSYYCCVAGAAPAQDTHTQPPDVDKQYAPFIRCAGFLSLAQLITGSLLMMDSAALMTPMDR
jgi:hypothetical protein